jgi:integrase
MSKSHLNDVQLRALSKVGRHSIGNGLYVRVAANGSKSFSFLYQLKGRRREIGLGGYPKLSLAEARKLCVEMRSNVANGTDPRSALNEDSGHRTFEEATAAYLAVKLPTLENKKHQDQWKMTLGPEYCRGILKKDVSHLTISDIAGILSPIWLNKHETASRLRGRIENVIAHAGSMGWRDMDKVNPAQWKNTLEYALPKGKIKKGHHAALPYAEAPKFFQLLKRRKALSAAALQFGILTATRTHEILSAKWGQINFETELWTIEALDVKIGEEYLVPLSSNAVALLKSLRSHTTSDFVFPGRSSSGMLSNMSMLNLLNRMGYGQYTVHGMRSTFRDWGGDETSHDDETLEFAIGHKVGDGTRNAYRRASAIRKRRALMQEWSNYLNTN